MGHPFIIEPISYISFENEAEQIEKCKEWGLLSEKAAKTKVFFYKGNGMNLECIIIGYVDKMTAVISFENEQKHCIHPSYLKEMQASSYGQKTSNAVEEIAPAQEIEADKNDVLLETSQNNDAAAISETIPAPDSVEKVHKAAAAPKKKRKRKRRQNCSSLKIRSRWLQQ